MRLLLVFSSPSQRLVVPHEELRVFLQNVFGTFAGYPDNGGVISLLPRLLEPHPVPKLGLLQIDHKSVALVSAGMCCDDNAQFEFRGLFGMRRFFRSCAKGRARTNDEIMQAWSR